MKIYSIKVNGTVSWDCFRGFVVVASSLQRALVLCNERGGDQGPLSLSNTTSEEIGISSTEEERIILEDFLPG